MWERDIFVKLKIIFLIPLVFLLLINSNEKNISLYMRWYWLSIDIEIVSVLLLLKLFGLFKIIRWYNFHFFGISMINRIVLFFVQNESIILLSEIFQTASSSVFFLRKRNKDYFKTQHFRSCHCKSSPACLSFKKNEMFWKLQYPSFLTFYVLISRQAHKTYLSISQSNMIFQVDCHLPLIKQY